MYPSPSPSPTYRPDTQKGVFKYLDASTVHVTPNDLQLIELMFYRNPKYTENDGVYPLLAFLPPVYDQSSGYGYWILVNDEFEEAVSIPLNTLMAYARAKGCQWIKLDPDGIVFDDLATYDHK